MIQNRVLLTPASPRSSQDEKEFPRLDLNIPVVNELVRLLVYAACYFKTPKSLQRGQSDTQRV